MPKAPLFGNWLVAIAEAAEVAGTADLDTASTAELTRAWDLVGKAADLGRHELAQKVAAEAGVGVADLKGADPHAALLVPGNLARRRTIMPMRCTSTDLVIATANPLGQEALREIASIASRTVRFEVAPPVDIATAVLKAYGKPGPGEQPSGTPPERVRPGGPHVLVVDDEAGARMLFRSILEQSGYRVTLAKDGPDAIRMLDENGRFDLITLDYYMNKMNGLRVLQQVRAFQHLASVPVIVVTGSHDRRIEMSLFEAGADDFISKPIDAPLFILRIQAVLRRRQLR